jgi:hypothetical protein
MSTKTLRNYIGLCEETFLRTNHLHYHLYRIKYNEIPLRKLLLKPFDPDIQLCGRTAKCLDITSRIILKEPILDTIYEVKMELNGNMFIDVAQTDGTTPDMEQLEHSLSCTYTRIHISNIVPSFIYLQRSRLTWKLEIDVKLCHSFLTVILDMRKGQDVVYYRINDTMLFYVSSVDHEKKYIDIILGREDSITLISTKHLKHLPSYMFNKRINQNELIKRIN